MHVHCCSAFTLVLARFCPKLVISLFWVNHLRIHKKTYEFIRKVMIFASQFMKANLVLLRLSKSVPKPRFFRNTASNRNRDFMPPCWRFWKRSSSSVLTVRWTWLISLQVLSLEMKAAIAVPRVEGEGVRRGTFEWMEESVNWGRHTSSGPSATN